MNLSCRGFVFPIIVLAIISVTRATDAPAKRTLFLPKSATAAAYVLGRWSNQELIEAPRSEFVYVALLQRKGLERKYRVEALEGLAKVRNTDTLGELLAAFVELDKKGESSEAILRELALLLLQTKVAELKARRPALGKLAAESQLPLTRRIAFAALVAADGSVEQVWNSAQSNPGQLANLIRSIEFIRDPPLRAGYYSKVEPLLHRVDPPELRQAAIAVVTLIPSHEVETFKTLASLVQSGTEKSGALASLQRIPKIFWPKESTKTLLDVLLVDLPKAPADQRSSAEFINAVQFAKDLASFLPAEEAAAIGKTLRGLGSQVILLRTIPEQMLFDQSLLVVEAGKPVEIILQNDDAMPHNLVITKPGAAEEVGNAAEKMSPTPDAQGRLYVPDLPGVVHATALVESGRRAKLAFTAPVEPGDYPFLCSFPGHWRRMLGTLAVVPDVEAYLAAHAATAPPKITEWKIADFATEFSSTNATRNLARGRELFTKLACLSCHKLGSDGNNFGPDLSDVFKRFHQDRGEVLRQVLEPSLVISNRYRNVRFALKNGDDVTGIILKEDAATVTVQTGPSDSLIQTLARADVESQQPKDFSPMPLGLLNALAKEEILDLLAWIETGGNVPAHEHRH